MFQKLMIILCLCRNKGEKEEERGRGGKEGVWLLLEVKMHLQPVQILQRCNL